MSNFQLHIMQSTFTRINNCLEEIAQVFQENDVLLLLEDAVFSVYEAQACGFKTMYVLENDHHLVQNPDELTTSVQIVDYAGMAELIAKADKVFNWR